MSILESGILWEEKCCVKVFIMAGGSKNRNSTGCSGSYNAWGLLSMLLFKKLFFFLGDTFHGELLHWGGYKSLNERISLYKEKTKCCGCGACMNICPKKAIRMMEDEYGFLYPKIDTYKCIACGLCKKVCGYQKGNMIQAETEKEVYAAVSSDDKLLNLSASGGVFSCIATDLLQDGGFVCGCSM